MRCPYDWPGAGKHVVSVVLEVAADPPADESACADTHCYRGGIRPTSSHGPVFGFLIVTGKDRELTDALVVKNCFCG